MRGTRVTLAAMKNRVREPSNAAGIFFTCPGLVWRELTMQIFFPERNPAVVRAARPAHESAIKMVLRWPTNVVKTNKTVGETKARSREEESSFAWRNFIDANTDVARFRLIASSSATPVCTCTDEPTKVKRRSSIFELLQPRETRSSLPCFEARKLVFF